MKLRLFLVLAILALVSFGDNSYAEESRSATVAECIDMTRLAAEMIALDKDAALAEIAKPDGQFVWKDSYVFAMI